MSRELIARLADALRELLDNAQFDGEMAYCLAGCSHEQYSMSQDHDHDENCYFVPNSIGEGWWHDIGCEYAVVHRLLAEADAAVKDAGRDDWPPDWTDIMWAKDVELASLRSEVERLKGLVRWWLSTATEDGNCSRADEIVLWLDWVDKQRGQDPIDSNMQPSIREWQNIARDALNQPAQGGADDR